MDWMEAIKPGSSGYLQRFTKTGSLHRRSDPPQYDPYSLAGPVEPDSRVSNGESVDVNTSLRSLGQPSIPPPQNYMEPMSSLEYAGRSLSEETVPAPVSPPCLSNSADARMLGGKHTRRDEPAAHVNPRQASHRATFTHSEREHQTAGLSRSLTERKGSQEKEASKNSDHLYELDGMSAVTMSGRPPLPDRPPPRAKPRNPPPRNPPPRNLSGSLSDSPAKASRSPDEEEPRYSSKPGSSTDTICKEPEYPAVSRPGPGPVPKERVKPVPANANKPVVTPRKIVGQPKPSGRPQKQPEQPDYLVLEGNNNGVESDGQVLNGSVSVPQPGPVVQSVEALPGISELMVQNFSAGQLDMLIGMLQQVQSEGKQQPAAKEQAPAATLVAERGANSTSQSDHNQMRKDFGKWFLSVGVQCILGTRCAD